MQEKRNGTVRLFVSRHLNAMVKDGFLITSGTRHKKVFRKTKFFEQLVTVSKENLNDNTQVTSTVEIPIKPESYICELDKIKGRLNAELAILLAEIDEYRSIMVRFPQTQEKVRHLHEQSAQQSVTLTGQITAITKTIELLQSEAVNA
ncbi:TPA: hypothetical protein NKZ93_001445 [Vibrio parahaemolyticus]|nr:hypothetical protein [Vibrio parahaemolyticus]